MPQHIQLAISDTCPLEAPFSTGRSLEINASLKGEEGTGEKVWKGVRGGRNWMRETELNGLGREEDTQREREKKSLHLAQLQTGTAAALASQAHAYGFWVFSVVICWLCDKGWVEVTRPDHEAAEGNCVLRDSAAASLSVHHNDTCR